MIQRKLLITFLVLLAAVFSMSSQADDCHDELVGYETIYYGYAGCSFSTACGTYTDYQYFSESPTPYVVWLTNNPCSNFGTVLCQGILPSSTLSPVYEEVCEPDPDPGQGGEILFQGQCYNGTECESASRTCYSQGGRFELVYSIQYYCYAN